MGDLSNEPSMEEILSSIKRIIAEDTDASLSAPRGRRAVGKPMADMPVSEPDSDEEDVLELTDAAPESAPEPVMSHDAPEEAVADEPMPVKPPLVSDATLSASRSSIAALSALVVKPEVHGGDTLEGLVREMLKPMLTQWLDEKLPDVVERLVAQEIKRITDR